MKTSLSESFAVRFADCIGRLRAIGLTGEVAVSAGVVMVSTTNKNSAHAFRKAIKTACAKTGAAFVERRPAKGAYVFTIVSP